MRITSISINKFRSIAQLEFRPTALTAICGPNSCGKSNVLRALKFAFLPAYSADRMRDNFCNHIASRNVQIKLKFDAPTPALVDSLGLSRNRSFIYSLSVNRDGNKRCFLNGAALTEDRRAHFVKGITVVHVPPIRDIAAEGLEPFRRTLADALRKTRGQRSFNQLNEKVKEAVQEKGRLVLEGARDITKQMLRVEELTVDTGYLNLEDLLSSARLKVKIDGQYIGLDKLGTGHQSSVILKLYRQLGQSTNTFVLYLFEEPDNHLHPTSLRAISEDLSDCAKESDAQVFLTTHSPYLINQFELRNVLALESDEQRKTNKRSSSFNKTDREIRIALGRFGLRPAEALLANKVVVAEGPNDVTVLRTLIELMSGLSADRQDILVVPAGGKQSVAELSGFLKELGINWLAFFDWDAVHGTSMPLFQDGLTPEERIVLRAAAQSIQLKLETMPNHESRAEKIIRAMQDQLDNPPIRDLTFTGSILEKFVRQHSLLSDPEQSSLEIAIRSRQTKKYRRILSSNHIWLWGGSIEEVIIHDADAESKVEVILRSHGVLAQSFTDAYQKRRALTNRLHACAHEPHIVREIVETIWNNGGFDRHEVKVATQLILN